MMLSTIASLSSFSLTISIISHNCCVLLASLATSRVMIVSPAAAAADVKDVRKMLSCYIDLVCFLFTSGYKVDK